MQLIMTQTDFIKRTNMVSRGQQRPNEVSKGQPSVLHLLPFSNNDAAEESTLVAPIDASKTSITENRVFPVLAVTRTPPPHTLSIEDFERRASNLSAHKKKRLLRASSERPSRDQAVTKTRAKSEYEIRAKRNPPTATLYIKSDDELVVQDNDTQNASSISSTPKPDQVDGNIPSKNRTLQKSLMNLYDLQKQGHITSFWHKKELSSIEYKHKKSPSDPSRASSSPFPKTLKMNVKELPRSKTPLVENDPDRLNMNHVIAFLQTTDIDSRTNDKKKDVQNSGVKIVKIPVAYDPEFVQQTKPAAQQNQRQNTMLLESPTLALETDKKVNEQSKKVSDETVLRRFPDFRPQSYPSYRVDMIRKNGLDKKQENAQHRSRYTHYSDLKTYNSIVSAQPEQKKRSESLHWRVSSDQQGEINISTMICNSSNNTGVNNATSRPFRLHRFLTIVPDRLPDVETKGAGSAESKSNTTPREGTTERTIRHNMSSKDKTDGANGHVQVRSDNRDFNPLTNLAINRLIKESPRRSLNLTVLKRGSHFSGADHDASTYVNGTRKTAIICLPSAEYDFDEDVLPSIAPTRENTRASFKQPAEAQQYEKCSDDRPKSSFVFGKEATTALEKDTSKTDPEDITSQFNSQGEPSLNLQLPDKKMEVPTTDDTHNDVHLHLLDKVTTSATPDRDLPVDVHIPSSLFLNYPSPYRSFQSSYAALPASVEPSSTHQRNSGYCYSSQHHLTSTSSSSTQQQTFQRSQVKLTLRKERDRTSALTYMSDMEVL